MKPLDAARERWISLAEKFAAERADDDAWLRDLRAESLARFADQGFPNTKQEEWRYTRVTPMAEVPFQLGCPATTPVTRSAIEDKASPVFACSLYVFVDGRFEPALSALATRTDVHVESLRALDAAIEPPLGSLVDTKQHPFAALSTALLDDGAVLRVPKGAQVTDPLHLVFVATGSREPRATQPRLFIDASENSRVQVIQDFVSLSDDVGLTNGVSEIRVGAGAQVDLVTIQRENAGSFHFSNVSARLGRDARFSHHNLTLGGRLVRNDLEVVLEEEGADCTLNGLFIGAGEQVIDNHTLLDHAVPHGTSRQLYKGILGGRSRGVFRGRVIVRPNAQKTVAYQSNPNLLLTTGARVDSKPQLEIYANDVKCGHGSSIGQLDQDAIFYLRTRAISEPRARQLLTRGFAQQILAALPVAALTEGLHEPLGDRLAEATSSPGSKP
ncbi:MAG: Fe-S cluster assembly protein SufD [Myxococcales bacterium]|nr:Fe-S cluster assembly protein SufD [Myxococcales bacterium]